ncbi:hypothetical protein XENORESO_020753, partial [Xenotaenia resolanae]
GPPKHKPPPPVKAGSSTEMLNKPSEPPTATEIVPLSPGDVYYEPTGGEPVEFFLLCIHVQISCDGLISDNDSWLGYVILCRPGRCSRLFGDISH